MNDRQQLAAMGEHMAKQAAQAQPLCMAKRIEELEGLLRETLSLVGGEKWREMIDTREAHILLDRIDSALSVDPPDGSR